MTSSNVKVKKNSLTHDVLSFSKVYNKPITFKDIRYMNPKTYNDISRIRRSVLQLSLHGFVVLLDDDQWMITPLGIKYLFEILNNN